MGTPQTFIYRRINPSHLPIPTTPHHTLRRSPLYTSSVVGGWGGRRFSIHSPFLASPTRPISDLATFRSARPPCMPLSSPSTSSTKLWYPRPSTPTALALPAFQSTNESQPAHQTQLAEAGGGCKNSSLVANDYWRS